MRPFVGIGWLLLGVLGWLQPVHGADQHSKHVPGFARTLADRLDAAGIQPDALAQPQASHPQAPGLFQHFIQSPVQAWATVDALAQLPALRASPARLWQALHSHAGVSAAATNQPARLPTAPPPAPAWSTNHLRVPADIPQPLAAELQAALSALAQAEAWRVHAFRALPTHATGTAVLAGLLPAVATPGLPDPAQRGVDWQPLLPGVDIPALNAGAAVWLAAAERLHHFVTQTPQLPAVHWRAETPWGTVLVDTTGQHNHHTVADPLLLLDAGGNDHYELGGTAPGPQPGIRLLLDHGGHDHYQTLSPGADPSSAVMGYGLLWDTQGNDRYHATWLAQGAAVLGMAMHIDDEGHNTYLATGMAQAFALGGTAVLAGSPGNDAYKAQTLAQAAAGPGGLALLLDPSGHDQYQLGTDTLVNPSAQLPDRNASLGQGTGFGAPVAADGEGVQGLLAGGLAVLIDANGNDTYQADVFAQGTGLRQGTGLLLDLAGNNHFNAAWYAMGAAAHHAVGVLWSAGGATDHYQVSHVTAMGAGHDQSVGMLLDAGGADQFMLGDLGLGAAHDGGHGVFVHSGQPASYQFTGSGCRGLGASHTSGPGQSVAGKGLFLAEPLPHTSVHCRPAAKPSP